MNKRVETLQNNFSTLDSVRVGVISDTHGEINTDIQMQLRNCDVILHAGDIGSFEVLKQLKDISQNIISVRGNNDVAAKWPCEEHVELDTISDVAEIKLPGGNIVITHDYKFDPVASRHNDLRQHFTTAKAIIYGHSHKLICDQSGAPWVLNPGAAGKIRTNGGASCLLIVASEAQWEVSEYRVEKSV